MTALLSTRNTSDSFGALIQEVRRFVAGAILFNQHLAEQLGVHPTDYQVLNVLSLRGSATPSEVARDTGLTTGGVTVVLDRLERAGFITREPNPKDRRSRIIRPVPATMRRILALYTPLIGGIHDAVSSLNAKELDTVIAFFQRANAARAGVLAAHSRRRTRKLS